LHAVYINSHLEGFIFLGYFIALIPVDCSWVNFNWVAFLVYFWVGRLLRDANTNHGCDVRNFGFHLLFLSFSTLHFLRATAYIGRGLLSCYLFGSLNWGKFIGADLENETANPDLDHLGRDAVTPGAHTIKIPETFVHEVEDVRVHSQGNLVVFDHLKNGIGQFLGDNISELQVFLLPHHTHVIELHRLFEGLQVRFK